MRAATTKIAPFGGWLLDRLVDLDEHHPGIVGHVMRASAERRHVISAFLALDCTATQFGSESDLGAFLTSAGHDHVLRAAYANVPAGFRAALRRGGNQPYDRRYYRYLHALLADERRYMRLVISRLPRVNPTRLRVARALPRDLRQPNIIMMVKEAAIARDLARLVKLLQGLGVDRPTMIASLNEVRSPAGIREWSKRWSFRVRLPNHPVAEVEGYKPIRHATDLKRVAIRNGNCARNYLANVLEERSAFAIATDGRAEAVVHLVKAGDQWTLDDVYGSGNALPPRHLEQTVIAHLRTHDIFPREIKKRVEGEWSALRRLAGHVTYED